MSERNPVLLCLLVAITFLTGQIAVTQSGGPSTASTPSQTRFLNPEGLNKPVGYTHVVVTEPRKLAYISGQLAWDGKGKIVGKGDFRAQVTKALAACPSIQP
jgi:hypothetical protein